MLWEEYKTKKVAHYSTCAEHWCKLAAHKVYKHLLLSSSCDLFLEFVNILDQLLSAALQITLTTLSLAFLRLLYACEICKLSLCSPPSCIFARHLCTLNSKYRYTNQEVYPRPTSSRSFGTCKVTAQSEPGNGCIAADGEQTQPACKPDASSLCAPVVQSLQLIRLLS